MRAILVRRCLVGFAYTCHGLLVMQPEEGEPPGFGGAGLPA